MFPRARTTRASPGSDDPATEGNAAWARFNVTGHKPKEHGSNLADWKDAKANGADLGVYQEDGAKAVLMADTAVTDNTGGLTPEPGDGQDPCAQKVDVTIQKVWNDGHAADRPTKITVKLKATLHGRERRDRHTGAQSRASTRTATPWASGSRTPSR